MICDQTIETMLCARTMLGDAALQDQPGSFHVAVGIDASYVRCAGVLIYSLLAENPAQPLIFHVFTDSMDPLDLQKFAELAKAHRTLINVYYINSAPLAALPQTDQYSTAIYLRLVMPQILQRVTNRFLYLDSDIVCLGSLSSLVSLNLQGNTVAAVSDVPKVVAEKTAALRLERPFYFNSGVLLIDITAWNQANLSNRVFQVLDSQAISFSLMDQDALNLVLNSSVLALPPVWNQIYDLGQMVQDPLPGTVFLHFTGEIKPWRLSARHRLSGLYRRLEACSPWAGLPLLAPEGYKEIEVYARLSRNNDDLATAFVWYLRYLWTKFVVR